jgi:hypothetical protein
LSNTSKKRCHLTQLARWSDQGHTHPYRGPVFWDVMPFGTYLPNYTASPERFGVPVTLLTLIRELFSSNLDRDTDHPGFSSVPPGKCRDNTSIGPHLLSSSLYSSSIVPPTALLNISQLNKQNTRTFLNAVIATGTAVSSSSHVFG